VGSVVGSGDGSSVWPTAVGEKVYGEKLGLLCPVGSTVGSRVGSALGGSVGRKVGKFEKLHVPEVVSQVPDASRLQIQIPVSM